MDLPLPPPDRAEASPIEPARNFKQGAATARPPINDEKTTGSSGITSFLRHVTAVEPSTHGLILHTSNRLEALAEALAGGLEASAAGPLEPEFVIVQSQGMARWLQLQLAARIGLCANAAGCGDCQCRADRVNSG